MNLSGVKVTCNLWQSHPEKEEKCNKTVRNVKSEKKSKLFGLVGKTIKNERDTCI